MDSQVARDKDAARTTNKAVKPLPKILIGLACLAVLVFGRWYFWSSLFPALAKPSGFPNREHVLATNGVDINTNHEFFTLPPKEYEERLRKRAVAGFRARLAHAHKLREQAIFPSGEELLTLWDLPAPERERVLQVRREMVAAAVQRMSEASAEEEAAWKELKALGLDNK